MTEKARHTPATVLVTVFYVECAASFSSAFASASPQTLPQRHPSSCYAAPCHHRSSLHHKPVRGDHRLHGARHTMASRPAMLCSELKMTAGHSCCLVLARPLLVRVPSNAGHIPSGGIELDSYLSCVSSGDRQWRRMEGHGERLQEERENRRCRVPRRVVEGWVNG